MLQWIGESTGCSAAWMTVHGLRSMRLRDFVQSGSAEPWRTPKSSSLDLHGADMPKHVSCTNLQQTCASPCEGVM